MRRAFTAVAALSVALALCVAPGGASAAAKSDSTVVITKAENRSGETKIRGKVKSGKASCKKNRTVKVYHDVPPTGPSSKDFLLGTVETNNKGKWRLNTPFAPDRVYAKVKSNSKCKKDTSRTEPVDFPD